MNIKEKLNNPELTFEDLHDLLDQAEAQVSFWGGRKVVFQDYTAEVSIDFLSDLVYTTICRNWDYNETERTHGKIVATKITEFYSETDNKIKNSNFFTRFLNFIREFSLSPDLTPRGKWEKRKMGARKDLFEFYTENQWKQTFPTQPIPATHCKVEDLMNPSLFDPIDPALERWQ